MYINVEGNAKQLQWSRVDTFFVPTRNGTLLKHHIQRKERRGAENAKIYLFVGYRFHPGGLKSISLFLILIIFLYGIKDIPRGHKIRAHPTWLPGYLAVSFSSIMFRLKYHNIF